MNLVVNARDAMPDGGKLTIETSVVKFDETYILEHPGTRRGDYVVLSVTDTGVGMTEEVKAHLFEAFFTTKPIGKGTGLGLATCQTIVLQCGGHIDVSSQVGRGTTFSLYFPRIPMSVPVPKPAPPVAVLSLKGTETLLVVEDDPSLRHLAQGILQA